MVNDGKFEIFYESTFAKILAEDTLKLSQLKLIIAIKFLQF